MVTLLAFHISNCRKFCWTINRAFSRGRMIRRNRVRCGASMFQWWCISCWWISCAWTEFYNAGRDLFELLVDVLTSWTHQNKKYHASQYSIQKQHSWRFTSRIAWTLVEQCTKPLVVAEGSAAVRRRFNGGASPVGDVRWQSFTMQAVACLNHSLMC